MINIFEFIKPYFGVFYLPIILGFIFDFFIIFIKDNRKKNLYRIRILFSIILALVISLIFLYYDLYMNISLDEENIIKNGILKYKLGYIVTYIAVLIYLNLDLKYIIMIFLIIIMISLFFLVGKEIIGVVKFFKRRTIEKQALRLEEFLKQNMIEEEEEE